MKTPELDSFALVRQFEVFKDFVETEDGKPLVTFESSEYLEREEGYKAELFADGRTALNSKAWTTVAIGNGSITNALIAALLQEPNNLVDWRIRDSLVKKLRVYLEAKATSKLREVEQALFDLYRSESDGKSFERLSVLLGHRYPLLAYLFFLKDSHKYLPTAPTYFEYGFELLGVEFKMAYKCSWENYFSFLGLIGQVRLFLEARLSNQVSLLDAHSFVWILANQMRYPTQQAEASLFAKLPEVARKAVIMARIGQGSFRKQVVQHWKVCAITQCSEPRLLRASHIKPWSKSTPTECLDGYNGILLSPTLDACFDDGYISFSDTGAIAISPLLSANDTNRLGIHKGMKLTRLHERHLPYLAYHRKNCFRKA